MIYEFQVKMQVGKKYKVSVVRARSFAKAVELAFKDQELFDVGVGNVQVVKRG